MDEELLRTFLAVHQTGTLTAASAILHRSQPAVSRRVTQLESDVGAPLFDRLPGGMQLNAAGRALLPFAQAALAAVDDGRRAVRDLHTTDSGPVTLALVGTLANSWLTGALRAFAASHPGVDLRVTTANSREVADLVRSGAAAVGVGYARHRDPALTLRRLFDEDLVVACAVDHPRAGAPPTALDALRDERWLTFPDGPARTETSARYINGVLAAAGIGEDAVVVIDSLTAQKRLVEAGLGIAIVPASSLAEELTAGTLATIELRRREQLVVPVTMVTRTHGYLSHAARSLVDALLGHDPHGTGPGGA